MVIGHLSWTERRLKKQIRNQMKRHKSKSRFKRLLLIAVALAGLLYFLYIILTEENSTTLTSQNLEAQQR